MSRRAEISLADFRLQAHNYGSEIKIASDGTANARELFKQEVEISLDQSDQLRTSIIALRNPVQDFCRLLDPHSDLPMEVVPFRYSLLMALHRIDYLANDLIIHITLYHKDCHTTRDMMLRHKTINRKLDELTKTIEAIPQRINVLLFQAHYHEIGE